MSEKLIKLEGCKQGLVSTVFLWKERLDRTNVLSNGHVMFVLKEMAFG